MRKLPETQKIGGRTGVKPEPPPAPPQGGSAVLYRAHGPAGGSTIAPPRRKPRSLFVTESRLREAFESLAETDPECELKPEEAERFIGQFVDREAVAEVRDEFGDFVVGMEAFATAKRLEAAELLRQAAAIEGGCDRMRAAAVKTMDGLGVEELRGHYRLLKLTKSRGSVEVLDEKQIPEAYWRTREDADLAAAEIIYGVIGHVLFCMESGDDYEPQVGAAKRLLQEMRDRRRSVDKNAIQKRWKEAGGDTIPIEQADREGIAVALFGKTAKELRDAGYDKVPTVPGTSKSVTTKLDIK